MNANFDTSATLIISTAAIDSSGVSIGCFPLDAASAGKMGSIDSDVLIITGFSDGIGTDRVDGGGSCFVFYLKIFVTCITTIIRSYICFHFDLVPMPRRQPRKTCVCICHIF